MTATSSWEPAKVVASLPLLPWSGTVYRYHNAARPADSSTGSTYVSGRYNCGKIHAEKRQEAIANGTHAGDDQLTLLDDVPERWEVLYLAQDPVGALVEGMRHVTTQKQLNSLNQKLTTLTLDLTGVLDCTDFAQIGLDFDYMSHDADYRYTQALARAAIMRGGVEALLVPSATKICTNVIVFPEHVADPAKAIRIENSIFLPLRLGTLSSGTLPTLTRPIQF